MLDWCYRHHRRIYFLLHLLCCGTRKLGVNKVKQLEVHCTPAWMRLMPIIVLDMKTLGYRVRLVLWASHMMLYRTASVSPNHKAQLTKLDSLLDLLPFWIVYAII